MLSEYPEACRNVDVRKFVVYGVLKGYIVRTHKYPILHESLRVSGVSVTGDLVK